MGILCVGAAGRPAEAQDLPPKLHHPAPALTLEQLDGGTVDLAALRGRPVVVNFWATWCAPCRDDMPELAARWRTHRSAGLEVLAVNSTDQERGKDVRRFVERLALPFPILLDKRGRMRERYALTMLPTTVFVDSAGVVRGVYSGALSPKQLDRALTLAIRSGGPAARPGPVRYPLRGTARSGRFSADAGRLAVTVTSAGFGG